MGEEAKCDVQYLGILREIVREDKRVSYAYLLSKRHYYVLVAPHFLTILWQLLCLLGRPMAVFCFCECFLSADGECFLQSLTELLAVYLQGLHSVT